MYTLPPHKQVSHNRRRCPADIYIYIYTNIHIHIHYVYVYVYIDRYIKIHIQVYISKSSLKTGLSQPKALPRDRCGI